jgi:hypothetical protein
MTTVFAGGLGLALAYQNTPLVNKEVAGLFIGRIPPEERGGPGDRHDQRVVHRGRGDRHQHRRLAQAARSGRFMQRPTGSRDVDDRGHLARRSALHLWMAPNCRLFYVDQRHQAL